MTRFDPPRTVTDVLRVERSMFGDWHVFDALPPNGEPEGWLLYLHGGGHALELNPMHWLFVARLVRASGWAAVVPVFPLIPEATSREIYPALEGLYRERVEGADRAALAGDSSGGTLALRLLQLLPEKQRPPRTLLFSPWLDAVLDNPEIRALEPLDRINSRNQLRRFAQMFAGGDDLTEPEVSPLRGPLDHLGHLTIFAGQRDILTPDVRLLARTAGAGTTVDVLEYDRPHAFMLLDGTDGASIAGEAAAILNR